MPYVQLQKGEFVIKGSSLLRMHSTASHVLRVLGRWQFEYHPAGAWRPLSVRLGHAPMWGRGFTIGRRELRWGRVRRLT